LQASEAGGILVSNEIRLTIDPQAEGELKRCWATELPKPY